MNTNPRIIRRRAVIISLAFLLCFTAQFTTAQQRGRTRAKPAPKTQAQEAESARRAKALTLLIETAGDARTIDDLLYRARLQAMAADALWPFDQQRARATFRRAWEAATDSDKAEQEQAAQETGETLAAVGTVTEARDEVLSKIAARDSSLASNFLRELVKDSKDDSNSDESEATASSAWREPSATGARCIALGYELLDKGDFESAYKIVAPIVNEGATPSLLAFLMRLSARDQSITFARLLFDAMIAQMQHDAFADANTVLLLSTPIVSPELMVAVDEYGALQFKPVARVATRADSSPLVTPASRRMFLNAAAAVLLRPTRPRPNLSETQDAAARYFAISRLLPFYEREAAQLVPELQARMNALNESFTDSRRNSLSSQVKTSSISVPPSNDPLRSHFEELARTSDAAERERVNIRIILTATRHRIWNRAQQAAAELSDESVRRAASSYIAVNQIADISRAYADEKEDDYESILSFLQKASVPPLAAAWGYAQAAQVAARKKDPQRVAELLTEATQYANRVDANTNQSVAAYGLIAQHAARLDQQRAWELLIEVVKAANALEDYTGDETAIEIKLDENATTNTESPFTVTLDAFRLDAVFATMARLDFERAVSSARSLDKRVPRVFAQLAISRATLEKK